MAPTETIRVGMGWNILSTILGQQNPSVGNELNRGNIPIGNSQFNLSKSSRPSSYINELLEPALVCLVLPAHEFMRGIDSKVAYSNVDPEAD